MDRTQTWKTLETGLGWRRREATLLAVLGEDAPDFLQRMLTRDLGLLETGHGRDASFTDRMGKLLATMALLRTREGFLARCDPGCGADLAGTLGRYVLMDRVRLEDRTATTQVLALLGPWVPFFLSEQGLPARFEAPLDHEEADGVRVVRVDDRSLPGVELWCTPARAEELEAALVRRGAVEVDDALDRALRVEAGRPEFGVDVDGRHLPVEAGLSHTVSVGKGCYMGQEILERMRARGVRTRELFGVALEAAAPPEGPLALVRDGEELGEVTSLVHSPRLQRPVGLAVLPIKAARPGDRVEVAGVPAVLMELPLEAPAGARGSEQEVTS